jgi:hypothetical protein
MKIRLTRKFADLINGVDLSKAHAGETLDLPERDADILLAEGWASLAGLEDTTPVRDKAHDHALSKRKFRKVLKARN